MLNPVDDLPAGVVGLRANGTVIAQDIAQALTLTDAAAGAKRGLIVYVDPDLDGYLSEIVSALDAAAAATPPLFQSWALVVPDGAVSEAEQFRNAGKLSIFPQSRGHDALASVAPQS